MFAMGTRGRHHCRFPEPATCVPVEEDKYFLQLFLKVTFSKDKLAVHLSQHSTGHFKEKKILISS